MIKQTAYLTEKDYCSKLYYNYNNIKIEFLKYFNQKTGLVDFDKFLPNIQKDLNYITKYIIKVIFNNDEEKWDISNTYDWIRICFDKYKGRSGTQRGLIIDLYYENTLQKLFCTRCNTILANIVRNRKTYFKAKKRTCKHGILSIEGDLDKMKELQDLKDYIDDIVTWQAYILFKRVLNKTESLIFDIALFAFYKQKVNITKAEIAKELKISERTIYRNIESIQNKWKQYKIDNNLK